MNEVRITNQKTGGEKGQKPERMDLLPWDVLRLDVSPLYAEGAKKYADHNWRKGYDWSLSIGALGRHFAQFAQGEDYDAETGCAHMASVIFHAAALLHFMRHHAELDDRWTPAALAHEEPEGPKPCPCEGDCIAERSSHPDEQALCPEWRS